MKLRSLALVAVILSTISGASLAASTQGHQSTVQQPVAVTYVTGSTTLVSLEGQLSGKPPTATRGVLSIASTAAGSLYGTTISYH